MTHPTQKVVVKFTLPSSGEVWNWPLEDDESINAFVEILDRANIRWGVCKAMVA